MKFMLKYMQMLSHYNSCIKLLICENYKPVRCHHIVLIVPAILMLHLTIFASQFLYNFHSLHKYDLEARALVLKYRCRRDELLD